MPTLYTALRARHRTSLIVPAVSPRAPKQPAARQPLLLEEAYITGRRPQKRLPRRPKVRKRVVIVGAGLAGLCAAYELRALGYEVAVYEARQRVGGRVHSVTGFVSGKVVEAGAELIGANHPLWLAYKQLFRLPFSKVREYGDSPVRVGGRTLSFNETRALTDQVELLLTALTDAARPIVDPFEPWINRDARRLDRLSLRSWLNSAKASGRGKQAVAEMMAADNGIGASQQSLLGVLAMVKGGGLDRYWTDTELYRCQGGAQRLAETFAARIDRGRGRILTDAAVHRITRKGGSAHITAVRNGAAISDQADDIILAIPPSLWRRIRFSDRGLSERLSVPPRLGANVKYLMRFRRRFWEDFASSPTLTEDGPVDLTWETTEAAHNRDFAMVAFSGAAHAKRCVTWPERQRRARYVAALQTTYPTIGTALVRDHFWNWPGERWTGGAYYFPRVGEVTRWGPFWRRGYDGWMHFAGEHTCYAFVGYMEGALASGYRLARRLAERDGLL